VTIESSPVTIASRGYAVLCPSTTIVDAAVPCTAVVQPWPTFSAKVDSVTLSAGTADANPQDTVAWNVDAEAWPVAPGASMMFEPGSTDDTVWNDDPASWCPAAKPWAGGDKGSPGAENDCAGP